VHNHFNAVVGLFQNLVVPETDNPESTSIQKSRARFIAFTLFGMLAAVDFNDQSGVDACEVDNEPANRVLPSKLEAVKRPPAQPVPKPLLGIGHLLAQFPRVVACLSIAHGPS
jgi:hypothetical protein